MAIGDAAAAAGLEVVPSNQDLRFGYLRINQKGDELAAEKALRVSGDATNASAVAAEAVARAAADALKFDAAKVIYNASTPTYVAGAIWLKPV